VNKALSDTKAELYESLHVKTSESSSPKKIDQREQQSLYKRFFSTIKDKLSEGGVGRVFITGVSPIALNDFTSGFNITKHITHEKKFESLCGIHGFEIEKALKEADFLKERGISKEKLMSVIEENYNGYMFTPTQAKRLFNTTLVVYFLDKLFDYEEIPKKLIDPNVQPSESGLEIISKSPLSQQVINELYEKEQDGIYIPYDISDTISTRDMMNLLQTNSMYILSFLYYLGALTQTFLPNGKESGTVFKIPNQVIRTQFIDVIKQRLYINQEIQIELIQSVNTLIENRDIGPLCDVIQQKVLSQLKGNDVIHSLENGLKLSFLLAMNLSGRKIQTLNEFQVKDTLNKDRWGDLVIEKDRIHVEYKNVKVGEVILPNGRWFDPKNKKSSWEEGISIAREIEELNDEELFKLELRYPIDANANENRLRVKLKTVRDEWENALQQTRDNQKFISQKLGAKVDSFCVLRVGLYRLKYVKIQE
jgi:hypothetical protein